VWTDDIFGLRDPNVFNFNPWHKGGGPGGGQFTSGPDTGGGSGGGVKEEKITIEDEEIEEDETSLDVWNAETGRNLTKEQMASIVGAQPGAYIKLTYQGHGQMRIDIEHDTHSGNRTIYKDHIANENFEVSKSHQSQGVATKVFSDQVKAASKLGFSYIETSAAGSYKAELNGYYTWPRLGYDKTIANITSEHTQKSILNKFPDAKKLSDLMKTKEGREWWKVNGSGLEMTFDLKEGSLSRKVLDAYVKEKKSRATPTTNRGRRGDPRFDLGQLTLNTKWKFLTTPQKIRQFKAWLEEQIDKELLEEDAVGRLWTDKYLKQAYDKGLTRGRSESAQARREQFIEFLESDFALQQKREMHMVRSFEDIDGFSKRMASTAARELANGLEKGEGPAKIAKRLTNVLGLEKHRARTIARTEIVRAQAEAQLDAYEENGIKKVSAQVEWVTAAGPGASVDMMDRVHVCKKCQALSGIVLTIKEARGLIPRHPNCRCAFYPLPAWRSDYGGGRKYSAESIRKSIKRSVGKVNDNWVGADRKYRTKKIRK